MSRCIAVMQPTYLPWAGYFDLMDQVDCFVLLDDVQFSRQSWQQRNRIKSREGARWLTVPVRRAGTPQRIVEVEIDDGTPWRRKHRDAILQGYAGTTGLAGLKEFIEQSYARSWRLLVDLNLHFITTIRDHLGISTPLRRASEMALGTGLDAVARLAAICHALEAGQYLSPAGAWSYLGRGEFLQREGIELRYQNYHPVPYRQKHPPFVPALSVLDMMFNEGVSALSLIRQGRGRPLSPEQFALRREVPA